MYSVSKLKSWYFAVDCAHLQPGHAVHLLTSPTEHDEAIPHHVRKLLHEVLQISQPMQLSDHSPTASNTVPPQKKKTYKTAPCDEHTTSSKNINLIKTHFRRTQPPLLAPRLSPTRGAALLEGTSSCRIVPAHHPQQRGLESHLLTFPTKHHGAGATQHLVKQLLREVLPLWQPSDHPPTASNTVPPTKKTSYRTAPCDEHTTCSKNTNRMFVPYILAFFKAS